jgi:hypothetical protein
MRLPRAIPTLLACSLALAGPGPQPAHAAWHALEEIPVESPVYRLVEDLSATYPLSSGLLLTRPWTRADLGRFLDQLVADVPGAAKDVAVVRLRRELEPSGGLEGLEPAIAADQEDASLELSPYVRSAYAEDRARDTVVRDHRAGLQGSIAFGDDALLFVDGYVGNVTPGAHGTPDADGSLAATKADVSAWYDRAYATWSSRVFTVRAGHTWLRWGPGQSGTLGLSDAAPAMDLLQGQARFGRTAQLVWFVASLDPASETYLAGHRVELRAGPSVDLSFSELARFDGAGSAPLYLVPVIPYALMERRVRASGSGPTQFSRVNAIYTADFSWTWRKGVRLYGEAMVDDITLHNTRPLAIGWVAGGHWRQVGPRSALSARAEYARVYPYTYSSATSPTFSHGDFPIGYALGPDADQWSARLEWRPGSDWAWGVEGSVVRKGNQGLGQPWPPGTPVPTKFEFKFPTVSDRRAALTADWSPSPSWSVSMAGGSAYIEAPGTVLDDAKGAFGSARATLRW